MKRLAFVWLLLIAVSCHGQGLDSIKIEGKNYYYKGREQDFYQLTLLMKEDSNAVSALKTAAVYRNAAAASTVLMLFLTTPLVFHLFKNLPQGSFPNSNTTLLTSLSGFGLASGASALFLSRKKRQEVHRAIDSFNGALGKAPDKVTLHFHFTGNEVGLALSF